MSEVKTKTVTVIGELTTLGGKYKVLRREPLGGFASNVSGWIATPDNENIRYSYRVYKSPSLVVATEYSLYFYPETEEITVIDLDPTLPENEFAIDVPELTEAEWQQIFKNGETLNENAQD